VSEVFPPAVAVFRSDVGPFIEGLARANGVTKDWQVQTEKAGVAAQKAGLQAEAAANRAAASTRRAAEAAAAYAKAQNNAAAASERFAAGQGTEQAVIDANTAALKRQAGALEAARTANLNVARAAQAQSDAQAAAAGVHTAAAAKSNAAWASVGAGLNKTGKVATIALAGIGIASIKLAGDFQQQTNVLVTAAGELPKNLATIRTGILDIASSTGTAWQKVTESVYDAEKAGFRGADSLKVAKAASQAAREEGADLTTVTSGLTRALSAYNLKGDDAVRVTNALKTGAGEAHATFQDYASGIGSFLSRAAAAKISLPDALGVYSSLTQQIGAQQAGQNIGSTIGNLSNVKGPQIAEFGQLGIDVVDFEKKLGDGPGGRGLVGSLNLLSETVLKKMGPAGTLLLSTFNQSQLAAKDAGIELAALPPAAQKVAQAFVGGHESRKQYLADLKALPGPQASLVSQFVALENRAKGFQNVINKGGPQAQTYLAALRLLTGGQEGLSTALAATGTNAQKTDDRVKRISDSFKTAGKDVQGWDITQKNFNVKFDQFKQQAERVGIQLGNQLIPKVEGLFNALSKHPALLSGIVKGLEFMAGAWLAIKFGNLIVGLNNLAKGLLGVRTAATEAAVATRGLAGAEGAAAAAGAAEGAGAGIGAAEGAAAAGAGAAAARGARGGLLNRFPLLKIAVPVAVTLGAIKVLGLEKTVDDLIHGKIGPALEHSPEWLKSFSAGIGRALKATRLPGLGGVDTGNITGEVGGKLAIAKGQAEEFWKVVDDKGKIADFQASLKNSSSLLNSNTNSLLGNSAGARSNRAGLEILAGQAKSAAQAYANTTGKQSDYTKALQLAVPAIEAAATATGLNKAQVDAYLRSVGLIPPEKNTNVTVSGYLDALNNVNNYLIAISKIPPFVTTYINAVATGSTQVVPGGTQGTFGGLFGAGAAGQIPHADGAIYRNKVPGGIMQWAEAGGESYIPHDPAKRSRALGIWAETGKILGVTKMASGGILQDLSTLGSYVHAQNQILGYNRANFAHATAANVPGLENAAKNAAAVAHAVGAYFNAHKAALFTAAHSGSATQRKAAGSLYNELASFAHITSSDAAQEASLAAQLRHRYAGPEAGGLRFGAASRDLSYLALSGHGTIASGDTVVHTAVNVDGKTIANVVSKVQRRTERSNLSNGATRIRIN
jgi:hypothetical protein